jgi:hypothetical protein
MALRLDPTSGIHWIWASLLVLGFLITAVGGIANYFTLTSAQLGYVGFIGFILTALVTLLTTTEQEIQSGQAP